MASTEVINARADAWGNQHITLGENIRNGQTRILEKIQENHNFCMNELEYLSQAVTRITGTITDINENLSSLTANNETGTEGGE